MGIILGLVAALLWGAGDFLARYATLSIGSYRTVFFMQFIGCVGLGCYLLVTGQLQYLIVNTTWQPWAWAILAALLNIISTFALYRAFEIGAITLVSPIAASYATVTVLLSFLSGEVLSPLHNVAIWVVLSGVIVAATPFRRGAGAQKAIRIVSWRKTSLQSIVLALAAALGYGMTFWLLGFHVTPELGGIVPVWLIRLITPCALGAFAPLARQPLKLPHGRVWWFISGVGVFDTVAYIAYTRGLLQQDQIAIVTMLSSLYSAVTVLLAWIFLREKLQGSQWLGIGVIFVGVILVNA